MRDYQGYLVADAHIVYDQLYSDGRMTEVGCWFHARRYHFKVLASDPEAHVVLDETPIQKAIQYSLNHGRAHVCSSSLPPIGSRPESSMTLSSDSLQTSFAVL
jgi:Transposase IS66 family